MTTILSVICLSLMRLLRHVWVANRASGPMCISWRTLKRSRTMRGPPSQALERSSPCESTPSVALPPPLRASETTAEGAERSRHAHLRLSWANA